MKAADMIGAPVISRGHAKAGGLKTFYIGTHCARGHYAERRVYDGRCMVCLAAKKSAGKKRGPKRKTAAERRETPSVTIFAAASQGLPDAPFDFD